MSYITISPAPLSAYEKLKDIILSVQRMVSTTKTKPPITDGESLVVNLFLSLEENNFTVKLKDEANYHTLSTVAFEFVQHYIHPDATLDNASDFKVLTGVNEQYFKDAVQLLKDLASHVQPFNPPHMAQPEFTSTVEKLLTCMNKPTLELDSVLIVLSPGLKIPNNVLYTRVTREVRCTAAQTAVFNLLYSLHKEKTLKYVPRNASTYRVLWDFVLFYAGPQIKIDETANYEGYCQDETEFKKAIEQLRETISSDFDKLVEKPQRKSVVPTILLCAGLIILTLFQNGYNFKDSLPGCNYDEVKALADSDVGTHVFPEKLCYYNDSYLIITLVSLCLNCLLTLVCTLVGYDDLMEKLTCLGRYANLIWVLLSLANFLILIPLGIYFGWAADARDSMTYSDGILAQIEQQLNLPDDWLAFFVSVIVSTVISVMSTLRYEEVKLYLKEKLIICWRSRCLCFCK